MNCPPPPRSMPDLPLLQITRTFAVMLQCDPHVLLFLLHFSRFHWQVQNRKNHSTHPGAENLPTPPTLPASDGPE